jgi:molecular chaperone DnaJ
LTLVSMTPEKRDYYVVLEVSRGCDAQELKKAYKRLAKACHPDLNQGDHTAEDRFKELAEAYDVLSDPEKRALYDQFGHQGPRRAGFQGFSGVEDILSQFADIFGGFGFGGGGGGRRRGGVQPGEDLHAQLTLTFDEAARGVAKELPLTRTVHCRACGGTGAKAGSHPTACGTCSGRGQVQHRQGIFVITTDCPTCRGRGRVVRDKCGECRGGGVQRVEETVQVHVPAGIDDGQTMRESGKGLAGPSGGPPGDLYVTVHVEPDTRFEREGDDVITRVDLSFAQATLGATVKVPTPLDGEVDVDVPAGTQPGTVRLLRGRGLPNVHGRGRGDLAVQLMVAVPRQLSTEQRALVEQLGALDPASAPGAHAHSHSRSHGSSSEMDDEGPFAFFRRKKKKR